MQKIKVPRYIQWVVLTGLMFLLLMTLLRVALVLLFGHNISFSSLVPAFLLGIRYDIRMVCIVSLIVFLVGTVRPLHPIKAKLGRTISLWLYGIFIAVFCVLYAVDFYHYAYLGQRLNGSVLNYSEDAKISSSMLWQSYPIIKFALALIAGIILLLAGVRLLYNFILSRPANKGRYSRQVWGFVFLLVMFIGVFGRLGSTPLRWSDAFGLNSDFKSQVSLNPFQSFFSSLRYGGATYDIDKVRLHYNWMAGYLGVSKPDNVNLNFERIIEPAAQPLIAGKSNVVLVICESFSAYKSSMVNNPLNTTPFFNQMVREGIYFENCFSPAYGTARGIWAIVTGTPDVQMFKTASRNQSAMDQHTIINDFAGYEKHYFLGGSLSWANIRGLLTDNVQDMRLHEEGDYEAAKIDVWGISDKNLFLEANKVLAVQEKPFFAIIQTADNHRPYTIPAEDIGAFQKKQVPLKTLRQYGFTSVEEYNAFRFTDFSFEKFIEAARKEKYFDNTIFVFVGDHGILGNAGDMLPKVYSTQSLTAEHVPLLFYAPGLIKPATYSFPASQVDIMPTIAGLCNIGYRNTTLGKDLLQVTATDSSHAAFVIDVDARKIGVVKEGLYYNYRVGGGGENIGSIVHNQPVRLTDSLRNRYRFIADAFYETSRYLLLHNKK